MVFIQSKHITQKMLSPIHYDNIQRESISLRTYKVNISARDVENMRNSALPGMLQTTHLRRRHGKTFSGMEQMWLTVG